LFDWKTTYALSGPGANIVAMIPKRRAIRTEMRIAKPGVIKSRKIFSRKRKRGIGCCEMCGILKEKVTRLPSPHRPP
jgi:hypothetical protein